jgi:hypothetical protein
MIPKRRLDGERTQLLTKSNGKQQAVAALKNQQQYP